MSSSSSSFTEVHATPKRNSSSMEPSSEASLLLNHDSRSKRIRRHTHPFNSTPNSCLTIHLSPSFPPLSSSLFNPTSLEPFSYFHPTSNSSSSTSSSTTRPSLLLPSPSASFPGFPNPLVSRSSLTSSSSSSSSTTTTSSLSHVHLPEWRVILKKQTHQVVLYNPSNHALAVIPGRASVFPSFPSNGSYPSFSSSSSTSFSFSSNKNGHEEKKENNETQLISVSYHCCPLCHQPFPTPPTSSSSSSSTSSSSFGTSSLSSNRSHRRSSFTSYLTPSTSFMPILESSSSDSSPTQTFAEGIHGPLESELQPASNQLLPATTFIHQNYFRLLADVHENRPNWNDSESSTWQSLSSSASFSTLRRTRSLEPSTSTTTASIESSTEHVHTTSINQGYYERFFVELKKLGRGARGSVFLCRHVLDNIPIGEYAIKKVAVGDQHPWLSRMLREVTLLERLRHPNIVHYKHAWLEHHQHSPFGPKVASLFILMEWAKGGNLEEYLQPEYPSPPPSASMSEKRKWLKKQPKYPKLPEAYSQTGLVQTQNGTLLRLLTTSQILETLKGIAQGLAHLHFHGIVHRDLKPSNLLLVFPTSSGMFSELYADDIPTVMISDFGECETLSSNNLLSRTGATGTLDFTAPELLMNERGIFVNRYSVKADIWSFGLLAYYISFGCLPFTQVEDIEILKHEIASFSIQDVRWPLRKQVPSELKEIILGCLSRNPEDRPTSKQLVEWLSTIQTSSSTLLKQTSMPFTTSTPSSTNSTSSNYTSLPFPPSHMYSRLPLLPPSSSSSSPSTITSTRSFHSTQTFIFNETSMLRLSICIKLVCMYQASFIIFCLCFLSVLGNIFMKWHRIGFWDPVFHLLVIGIIYVLENQVFLRATSQVTSFAE